MEDNYTILALVVASISVAIAIASFVLSLKKSKIEKLTHESQFITNIHHELTKVEERLDSLKSQHDCYVYATDFLNAILKLCYFDSKKYLSKDIVLFFEKYLKTSLTLYDWLVDVGYYSHPASASNFIELIRTCQKYGIKSYPDFEPVFDQYRTSKK